MFLNTYKLKELMKIFDIHYSPSIHGRVGLLQQDKEAWNLAWLSHPVEAGPHRDPHFSSLVRRTLQTVIATGGIDLIDAYPDNAKVRGYLRLLPAQAVLRITQMKYLEDTPLYAAYGAGWVDTMLARSRLYREPHERLRHSPSRLRWNAGPSPGRPSNPSR